jgi:4-amino-4-deoxy-L-arabinose transferase-like glycosyltransferase
VKLEIGTNSNCRKVATFLFFISVAIRLVALWLLPEPHLSANASIAYLGGAHMLHEGEGFRDPAFPVFTPPLYALLITGGLSIFGDDQTPIKLAQVIADSLTTVVVYFIVLEVFTAMSALLSGLILTAYPFSVYATLYIGAEAFFTLFLSVFVLLVLYALKYGKWLHSVGAGFVLGLATLTRGTTQMLPLVLPFAMLANPGCRRRWMLHCTVVVAVGVLVVLPWSLRNYLVLQEMIPVASVAGGNFLFGSSEQFWTIKEREQALPKALERLKAHGVIGEPPARHSPVEADRYALVAGLENYRLRLLTDPVSFVPFGASKFLHLWYATESGANHGIILAVNLPLYCAFVVGVVLAVKQGHRYAFLLLGLLGYFIVLHLAMVPLFRYMLPVMPYVIAFASFALCEKLGSQFPRWVHSVHRGG